MLIYSKLMLYLFSFYDFLFFRLLAIYSIFTSLIINDYSF